VTWRSNKRYKIQLSFLEYSPTWETQNGYQVPVWTFPKDMHDGIVGSYNRFESIKFLF